MEASIQKNKTQNSNNNNLKDHLLKTLDNSEENISNAILQIKTGEIKKIIHNIYVVVCILIIFFSLCFLIHSRFIFSTLTVLCITLLHFKPCVLEFIYEMINIQEYSKNK